MGSGRRPLCRPLDRILVRRNTLFIAAYTDNLFVDSTVAAGAVVQTTLRQPKRL
jgi:hypothetical protein